MFGGQQDSSLYKHLLHNMDGLSSLPDATVDRENSPKLVLPSLMCQSSYTHHIQEAHTIIK